MKREIKFRGKIAYDDLKELEDANVEIPHNNGWVVGSFIAPNLIVGDVADIDVDYFATEWRAKVIPETVGQFTGLKDKNGVEIYEGDKFKHRNHKGYILDDFIGVIKFEDGCFGYEVIDGQVYRSFTSLSEFDELKEDFLNHIEVIGNIHDKP